jgi:hypothetical protein
MNLRSVVQYARLVMSDNGIPSSSRWLTLFHSLVSCGCLIFVTVKNHGLPDGMTLTGLGTFSVAPYAINRASNMFGGQKKDRDSGSDATQDKKD